MHTCISVYECACPPLTSVSVPPFGYLRSVKLDFDVVKNKVGLLNKWMKTSHGVHSPSQFLSPPQCLFAPFGYLRGFKSDFNSSKAKSVYSMSRSRLAQVAVPPHNVPHPSVYVPPIGYLRCFKSDFDAVKSRSDLLIE